jgi:hypothetical protein
VTEILWRISKQILLNSRPGKLDYLYRAVAICIQCPAEFIPVATFYVSETTIDRNMGASLKDAESFQVSSRLRPVARMPTQ